MANVFAASLIIIVFFIAKKLTNNNKIALITAFMSGFIPAFFDLTLNDINVNALAVPLIFLATYFFINIEKENCIYWYLFIIAMLSALSPVAIVLILALLVYLLFVRLEGLKQSKAELEIILLSTFLVVWRNFVFYKKALLSDGYTVLWHNVPSQIISSYFSTATPVDVVLLIGLLPLIAGVYASYRILFREKNRNLYIFVSLTFVAAALLWLKLIDFKLGLTIVAVPMIIMFSYLMKSAYVSLRKTRFYHLRGLIAVFLFLVFVVTSCFYSFASGDLSVNSGLGSGTVKALQWLKQNSEQNSTVLGALEEGHPITEIAQRKDVWDSNFLLVENVDMIYKDVERMYKTGYETEAVELLNKYGVDYILLTKNAKNDYGIDDLAYSNDKKCFNLVYSSQSGEAKIYKSLCRLS